MNFLLPNTTQGPLWPPSSLTDENGDFILVGNLVTEVAPGVNFLVPGQAALISKHTVPPLNAEGREDFTNPFGAVYEVIRFLDLSPGSSDLDMVLHTNSVGPAVGDFGGGPRIPREGETLYNLNSFVIRGTSCPERFPLDSQRETFFRDSLPLHRVPIPGFQGDQVAYDPNTGEPFDPMLRNGADCPPDGCSGEDNLHRFPHPDPIRLGDWLEADVRVQVRLSDYDREREAFTAATVTVNARNLLPNSIYNIVVSRTATLIPSPIQKLTDLPVPTSVLITDDRGRAQRRFKMPNPFPDPVTDDAGTRVVGFGMTYRSDFTLAGHCGVVVGPGHLHVRGGTTAVVRGDHLGQAEGVDGEV
ncbi:MAG: hypothetical protein ACPGJE_02545, partial [Wenzhouxiangellaceae bacterium]